MKKMLLLAIIATACLISCEKPPLTTEVQTDFRLEKISDDKLFEEMIKENYRMYTNISDIELLINYLSYDVISKKEADNIHLIYGYPGLTPYKSDNFTND